MSAELRAKIRRSGFGAILAAQSPRGFERDQTSIAWVPEFQLCGFEAVCQGHPADRCERRVVSQDLLQTIERHAAVEMVNMMDTNIRRQPQQRLRQDIVRTAIECSFMELPGVIPVPDGAFKLVLHVEQPNAGDCGKRCNEQIYHQEGEPADRGDASNEKRGDRDIGAHRADPILQARAQKAHREAMVK